MTTRDNISPRQMTGLHTKTNKQLEQILKKLKVKSVFVFDWDGTIIDSMAQKAENFAEAFCSILPGPDEANLRKEIKVRFLQLSGYPRKQIFDEIIVQYKNQKNPGTYAIFNVAFKLLNKDLLPSSKIFPDALVLLQELIKNKYMVFISSSVPQQELSNLVEAILPKQLRAHVSGVFGSEQGHTKGRAHLKTIMEISGASPENMIVFGDDIADHELSSEAGVDCIIIDRSGLGKFKELSTIRSLNEIKSLLLR